MRALLPWLAVARAVDLHVATTAEGKHLRPFWSIGEGFEGSASDWVEYFVWLLGVIGVFFYMMNPNMRRNLHEVDHDEPVNYEPMGEGDEDWERSDERRPKES